MSGRALPSAAALALAVGALACAPSGNGTALVAASRLFETSPFGKINQPTFVNAVARIRTAMPPEALMQHLHDIERRAGRRRRLTTAP